VGFCTECGDSGTGGVKPMAERTLLAPHQPKRTVRSDRGGQRRIVVIGSDTEDSFMEWHQVRLITDGAVSSRK
jgi:hypothetical protein